jgi:hypothetical protein
MLSLNGHAVVPITRGRLPVVPAGRCTQIHPVLGACGLGWVGQLRRQLGAPPVLTARHCVAVRWPQAPAFDWWSSPANLGAWPEDEVYSA